MVSLPPSAFRLNVFAPSSLILHPSSFILFGRPVFPLNELFISAVFLLLIVAGLYFLGGAWGVVLLWGLGVFALLPMAAAPIGLFLIGREKIGERRWPGAAGALLGSLLLGLAWLAAVGYCAYRGYHAVP